ncbi:type VII secretion integral membrane protein EccD [Mycobacterium sp. 21AC1]|uniref:type VII secretion integral membrane protein EccD n=1 Tax=[Mycobacterium] appelbergii TaxID=2939269 RepID=UPI002938F72C|nr:type VII secretion integral membrane protein EccD [Mycobacterium sp. 21AC1]MDV3128474.1 type VII secretion integral membrane protein EccD [Mycobacterium sp. 21AC1]
MTLPPTLSTLDGESEEDQRLSRVTVVVGAHLIDVALSTTVSVSVLAGEVVDMANLGDFDDPVADAEGRWTFARLGGAVIDPRRTLAEAGVFDGDVLLIRQAGDPSPSILADELTRPGAESERPDAGGSWLRRPATGWYALSTVFAVAAVLVLPTLAAGPRVFDVPVAAFVLVLAGAFGAVSACVTDRSSADSASAPGPVVAALPLLFGGLLYVLPMAQGVAALPVALAVTALTALLLLLLTGTGRVLFSGVIALAAFGIPVSLAQLTFDPAPRTIGAVLASVAVVVVYLASGITIMASRLPVPRVPTAGEPLDDIEIQGGTAVDGVDALRAISLIVPTEDEMIRRVRRASDYLTGVVAAAAAAAAAGAYLANDVDDGFHWQGAVFGIAVTTVLCLRGRSHHDLFQAATLIGSGLLTALLTVAKVAVFLPEWRVVAALALIAMTTIAVVCGVVAPKVEFSPVMRRIAELGEYLAVFAIVPLACWIIGVYAFFRGLRL